MRAATAAAAIAAVLALGAGERAAGDGGEKTRIVIKRLAAGGAAGKVTSERESCEGRRKVTLFVAVDFISAKVAITESDARGRWETSRSLGPGSYFAKVDSSPGCRYDVSRYRTLE